MLPCVVQSPAGKLGGGAPLECASWGSLALTRLWWTISDSAKTFFNHLTLKCNCCGGPVVGTINLER